MELFAGYKLKGQDLEKLNEVLSKVTDIVKTQAQRSYKELLANEVETMIDYISLNKIPRPENISIFDASINGLNNKIAYASARKVPTEYNFSVDCNILFFDGDTYIKFNAQNNIYKKAIGRILNDDFSEFCCNDKNQDEWEKIVATYKDHNPLGLNLFTGFDNVEAADLKFKSPVKRASVLARQELTNMYLSMYAENEIRPYELMEKLDKALGLVTNEEISKSSLKDYETKIRTIIPIITAELITKMPDEQNDLNENEE